MRRPRPNVAIREENHRLMQKRGVRSLPDLVRLDERIGIALEPVACTEPQTLAWKPILAFNAA
jgi:hypothetical protein